MKRTKMVCTIGPKSEPKEVMSQLVDSGMNVIRLNFSHGDFEEHGGRIKTIKEIMKETGKKIAILLDTKGPEIRTMKLADGKDVSLVAGNEFTVTTDQTVVGDATKVAVTYENIVNDVKAGDFILLDDGLIALEVKSISGKEIKCLIKNNGDLGEKKGVNLPGVVNNLPALGEKDKGDLIFGCQQGVDFVAASFIRKKEDVLEVRKVLDDNGGKNIKIISKIENQQGVDNFEEILALSDGIMVARGDLGTEVPLENVPILQKMMIRRCNEEGKMVITATQMLESMQKNPRPTRAEVNDVANAILDGTDAVMLSGESAKGKYPVVTVQTMARICVRTEQELKYGTIQREIKGAKTVTDAVSKGAVEAAEKLGAKAIVVATESGRVAREIRKYFPTMPVVALTSNEQTARQLGLSRGVFSYVVDKIEGTDAFYSKAAEIAVKEGVAAKGDIVVMVAGVPMGSSGSTNMFKAHVIA